MIMICLIALTILILYLVRTGPNGARAKKDREHLGYSMTLCPVCLERRGQDHWKGMRERPYQNMREWVE
jgi:hypothetical protein